ncbi:MAG: carboxypeptidase-like regulatory domain-containing protein [Cyclobacteriaceae bacterium]|nr:carboxypeptidase-like regulatory domain-containing protein [Cyclobacteriaceae bacterium]
MSRFLVLLLVSLFCQLAISQTEKKSINGKVIDATTKDPLPFVNVFLANTTTGTSSLADGTFLIEGIVIGKYDLVA